MAENIRRQVRGLAAAVHGVVMREGSLCPAAAAALQEPGQAPPQAPPQVGAPAPRRARGLAAAVGGGAPQRHSTPQSSGGPDAGDSLPRSPEWEIAPSFAAFRAWRCVGTARRRHEQHGASCPLQHGNRFTVHHQRRPPRSALCLPVKKFRGSTRALPIPGGHH